jgi:hypothetical protein
MDGMGRFALTNPEALMGGMIKVDISSNENEKESKTSDR